MRRTELDVDGVEVRRVQCTADVRIRVGTLRGGRDVVVPVRTQSARVREGQDWGMLSRYALARGRDVHHWLAVFAGRRMMRRGIDMSGGIGARLRECGRGEPR